MPASLMSDSLCAQYRGPLSASAFFLLIAILLGTSSFAQSPAPTSKTNAPLTLPACPAVNILSAPSRHYSSRRKVILSWNASAPAQKPQDAVVGYCLYRSKMQDAAHLQPTCNQCEQINRVPVNGISCVDDLVEDKATYYYVVTAVNSQGTASKPSNEASAQILDPKKPAANDAGTVPSCRAGLNGAAPSAR
jgi:hypothetical protein